jgi:hypothetical protein
MTLLIVYFALGLVCVLAVIRTRTQLTPRSQVLTRIERALRDLDGHACMSERDRARAVRLLRAAAIRMDLADRRLRELSASRNPTADTRATHHRRHGVERLGSALAADEQRLAELADLAEALAAEQLLARGGGANEVDDILTEMWSRLETLDSPLAGQPLE